MKIRTQLMVSMAVFILLFAILCASIIVTHNQEDRINDRMAVIGRIGDDIFVLNKLSSDFLLDPGERQRIQWEAGYAALSDDLLHLEPHTPEQQALVAGMQADALQLREVFSEVADAATDSGFPRYTPAGESFTGVSWSRIALIDQGIAFDLDRISQMAGNEAERYRQTHILLMFALVGTILVILLTNYFLVYRRFLASVSDLTDGAAVFGAGNLDYRIPEAGDDEFRHLASSFNAMAASRKAAYGELQRKNEETMAAYEQLTAAEEELRQNYEELALSRQALADSEAKYRLIADNAEEWIYLVAPDGTMIYSSPSCERMTGYTGTELAGRADIIGKLVHPEDRHLLGHHAGSADRTGGADNLEFRIVTKTGEVRWISHSCSPVFTADGNYAGRRAANRNITREKEAETTIRIKDELLHMTGEIAHVGGWELDVVTGNATWNDEVAMIHDLDPAVPPGMTTIMNFYKETSRAIIRSAMTRAVERAEPFDLELELVTAKGRQKWVRTIGIPIREGSSVTKIRGVIQDITAYKQIETDLIKSRIGLTEKVRERTRELTEANLRLQDLDRLKSMFIASMSHELRTPLNSIIGFTGILVRGLAGDLNDEQKKQLLMVQDSSRHLLALINDVIDISKIEAGKIEPSISTFDLAALIRDIVRVQERAAAERGLAIDTKMPDTIPVTTDERRVRQVLLNLITNAIKFTDEGQIYITAEMKNGSVEIAVRDTGIGIRGEDFPRLFEPFVRFTAPGRITEGTGLGLYLARKLARFLGGDLTAVSEPGKGSVFTFILPARFRE